MAGPTTGVPNDHSSERRWNESSPESEGESIEDEPWDQRRPGGSDDNIMTTIRPLHGQPETEVSWADDEEDELLDDGDLPSLAARGSDFIKNKSLDSLVGCRVVGGQRTTLRPLKPSSDKGLEASPSAGRRKFRARPVEKSEYPDDNEQSDETPNHRRSSRKFGRKKYSEEDGPDDEMAARRSDSRIKRSKHPRQLVALKDYDTDDSASTGAESQLTEDEIVEEDAYDISFCGQTLNAIDDMCGGSLSLTGNGKEESKGKRHKSNDQRIKRSSIPSPTENKRFISISPPLEKDRRSSTSPSSAKKSPPTSRSPPLQVDTQQEHTAVEVEFVDPINATASELQGPGGLVHKRNAYLSAMAKMAKENFKSKKAKNSAQTSSLQKDAENNGTQKGSLVESDSPNSDAGKSANTFTNPSVAGTSDSDYSNFNPSEKRKFIKLINGGVVAADATRQIVEDRKVAHHVMEQRPPDVAKADESEEEKRAQRKGANVAARLASWKRAQSPSELDAAEDEHVADVNGNATDLIMTSKTNDSVNFVPVEDVREDQPVKPAFHFARTLGDGSHSRDGGLQPEGLSVSNADCIPFKKSGILYYDAVRREADDDFAVVHGSVRASDAMKGLEVARGQRLFGAGKLKGFSALPDSPEKRSASAPRQRPTADDDDSPLGFRPQKHVVSVNSRSFGSDDVQSALAGTLAVSKVISSESQDVQFAEKLLPSSNLIDSSLGNQDRKATGSTNPPLYSPKLTEQAGLEIIHPAVPIYGEEETPPYKTDRERGNASLLMNSRPRSDLTPCPPRIHGVEEYNVAHVIAQSQDMIASSAIPSLAINKIGQVHFESNPRSSSPRAIKEHVGAISSVDVSMDTYYTSTTDAYISSAGPHNYDNMSVYTAGTSITGATSHTQSTRVRRPGVAKTRLAKQKEIEQVIAKKKQGWHDTIRAAAESTNRTWDPKKGWVDYAEPETAPVDLVPIDKGKIRIDLDRSVLSHKEVDSSQDRSASSGPPISVPFPQEWEKERDAMIFTPANGSEAPSPKDENVALFSVDQSRTVVSEENKIESSHVEEIVTTTGSQISGAISNERSKPTGWMESMRAASELLAKKGKVWDPEYGWTSVDSYGSISDIVDFNNPAAQNEAKSLKTDLSALRTFDLPQASAPLLKVNDIPEEAHMQASAALKNLCESSEESHPQASASSRNLHGNPEPRLLVHVLPQDADTKLNRWIAKIEKEPRRRSDFSAESSDKAVASLGASSPVEPGNNIQTQQHEESWGTEVQLTMVPTPTFTQYEPYRAEETEDDSPPLISQSSTFPSLEDRNIVHVVKEKVDKDDLNLFPRDDPKMIRGSGHPVSAAASAKETLQSKLHESNLSEDAAINTTLSLESRDLSPAASRRGGGPIDLDEVDETWDSDEHRHSNEGQSDRHHFGQSGNSRASKSELSASGKDGHCHLEGWNEDIDAAKFPSPRTMNTQVDGVGRWNDDWSTARSDASPSTRVPKLKRSKRDTSPLNLRNLSVNVISGAVDEPLDESRVNTSNEREASPFRARYTADGPSLSPLSDRRAEDTGKSAMSPSSARKAANEQIISPRSGPKLPITTLMPNNSGKGNYSEDDTLFRPKPFTRSTRAVAQTILKELKSPDSPSVKARMQEWETRIELSNSVDADEPVERIRKQVNNAQGAVGVAGWKSFLGKKVEAESAAAAAVAGQSDRHSGVQVTKEPEGEYIGSKPKSRGGPDFTFPSEKHMDGGSLFQFGGKRRASRANESDSSALDLSDLSPINAKEEVSDTDETESEAYGPTLDQRRSSSFFQRLTECAAPMMPNKQNHGENSASPPGHLSSRFVTTSLCGRPNTFDEPDSIAASSHSTNSTDVHRRSMSFGDEKPMSTSRDKIKPETFRVSSSSVVSEDFGAKTAYLDALAMRAAVSKPRRSSSRRHERSAGSSVASPSVTSGSTDHSEKWKSFLERKRVSASPGKSRASTSDVSRAAEKYAAAKVDEIMTKMASRSRTVSRSRDVHKEINGMFDASGELYDSESSTAKTRQNELSVTAAEDLAAARVEAMMAALSTPHLDEGEI